MQRSFWSACADRGRASLKKKGAPCGLTCRAGLPYSRGCRARDGSSSDLRRRRVQTQHGLGAQLLRQPVPYPHRKNVRVPAVSSDQQAVRFWRIIRSSVPIRLLNAPRSGTMNGTVQRFVERYDCCERSSATALGNGG